MTANKYYVPAYIGGNILALQYQIQNTTDSDITLSSQNGIYYSFLGRDFQLLSCEGKTVKAGETITITKQLYNAPVPSSDIAMMVDTAGLAGCIINAQVLWGV